MNRRELNRCGVPIGYTPSSIIENVTGYTVLYVPPPGESIIGKYYMAEDGHRVHEIDFDDALMYVNSAEFTPYKKAAAFAFMFKDKLDEAKKWHARDDVVDAYRDYLTRYHRRKARGVEK